jgi:ribosomal protein S18 acetylase RimI-like enzyme
VSALSVHRRAKLTSTGPTQHRDYELVTEDNQWRLTAVLFDGFELLDVFGPLPVVGDVPLGQTSVMVLRERHGEDLEALVAIAARVRARDGYPIFLPGNDFVRFLTRPEPLCAWVAEHDGRVVGHIALNSETSPPVMQLARQHGDDGGIGFVARLLVDPSARRLGHGARLLDHAKRAAIAHGLVPMLDVVATSSAAAAISLYRRAGWQEVGRTMFTTPDDQPIEELVFLGPNHGDT